MPELPEVETIKRGLTETVLGKKIKTVIVRLPKVVSLGPKVVSNIRIHSPRNIALFKKILKGQRVVRISRRAKMFLLKLSGPYTLLIHLKMTGQLIFAKKGERKMVKIFNTDNSPILFLPHKYTHAIFEFTDGARLYYNDLRQFGYLRLVKDEELVKVPDLAAYGPEPLSKDFTRDYLLVKAKRRPSLTVKQFLTDPEVVAGIGNIYSDEILYGANIRPSRRMRSLTKADLKALFQSIPKVLKKAVTAQGSSVGDFFKVDGSEGRFGRQHMVYARYGQICYECGSRIEKVKLGGRTASFCPVCQK